MFNTSSLGISFTHRAEMAKTLYAMSQSLGLHWDFASIHLALCKTLEQHRFSFRLGGACFDIPIGYQRASIRCDIGGMAGGNPGGDPLLASGFSCQIHFVLEKE